MVDDKDRPDAPALKTKFIAKPTLEGIVKMFEALKGRPATPKELENFHEMARKKPLRPKPAGDLPPKADDDGEPPKSYPMVMDGGESFADFANAIMEKRARERKRSADDDNG